MSLQLVDFLIQNSTDTYDIWDCENDVPGHATFPQNSHVVKRNICTFRIGKGLALQWKDKKDVVLLPTAHTTNMKENEI